MWGQRCRLWTLILQGYHLTPCWPQLLRTEWNHFAPIGNGPARRLEMTWRKHSTFINFSRECLIKIRKSQHVEFNELLDTEPYAWGDSWAFVWRNKRETTSSLKTCLYYVFAWGNPGQWGKFHEKQSRNNVLPLVDDVNKFRTFQLIKVFFLL